eukprot:SAG11_NODE_10669_length_813_cov_1.158263_1_plen_75_part_00
MLLQNPAVTDTGGGYDLTLSVPKAEGQVSLRRPLAAKQRCMHTCRAPSVAALGNAAQLEATPIAEPRAEREPLD